MYQAWPLALNGLIVVGGFLGDSDREERTSLSLVWIRSDSSNWLPSQCCVSVNEGLCVCCVHPSPVCHCFPLHSPLLKPLCRPEVMRLRPGPLQVKEPFYAFKNYSKITHWQRWRKGGGRQVIGGVCFTNYYGGLNIGGSFKGFNCLGFCVLLLYL